MKILITMKVTRMFDLTSHLEGQPPSGADASAVSALVEEYVRADPVMFIDSDDAAVEVTVEEA